MRLVGTPGGRKVAVDGASVQVTPCKAIPGVGDEEIARGGAGQNIHLHSLPELEELVHPVPLGGARPCTLDVLEHGVVRQREPLADGLALARLVFLQGNLVAGQRASAARGTQNKGRRGLKSVPAAGQAHDELTFDTANVCLGRCGHTELAARRGALADVSHQRHDLRDRLRDVPATSVQRGGER